MAEYPTGGYASTGNGSWNPNGNGVAAAAPSPAASKAPGPLPVFKIKLGASAVTIGTGAPSAAPASLVPKPAAPAPVTQIQTPQQTPPSNNTTFSAPSPVSVPRPAAPPATPPSALPPVRIAPPQPYRPPQTPPPSSQHQQSSPSTPSTPSAAAAGAPRSLKVTLAKPAGYTVPSPVPAPKPMATPPSVPPPRSVSPSPSPPPSSLHYHPQQQMRMPPPQIASPVPFPRPLQTTGTTVATVMGLNSSGGHTALSGSGGTPKLSSKFVFKVAKPATGDASTPVVVAVEQRPKLYIRLPRALIRQELDRLKHSSKAQKSKPHLPPPLPPSSSSKSKKAKRPRDDGMGPNDEFVDVDGDDFGFGLSPAPKRQKVAKEPQQTPSAAPGYIEGYTSPPEGTILVPFQDGPSYVPVADPARKYMPLKKVLHTTLRSLIQLDRQAFFYAPVTEDQAPGYFDIVKRPMDFTTMRRKIEDNKYPFLSLFQYDFEQIIRNCLDYNEPDTVFYTEAQSILRQGREIIATNRLKVHPRHLEAPAEVLQYALAEDEKQRQREAEERANGGGATSGSSGGGLRDFPDPEPPRGSRASAQRAGAAAQNALDEDEDALPRSDMDLIRQFVQPPRTFLPKRHYVELAPQPKPATNPPGGALPTAAASSTPLPIGRSHSGRGGPAGPSTRSIPSVGPDGRPYITPLNRWQLESSMLLKMVNHRYCNGPLAFEDYARSVRAFAGIDDGWAPAALQQKIDAALQSISKEDVANHAPWSALRMIKAPSRAAAPPKPAAASSAASANNSNSKDSMLLPADLQAQLSRLHVAPEQLTGGDPELTADEINSLKALQSELGLDVPLYLIGDDHQERSGGDAPAHDHAALDETVSSSASARDIVALDTQDKMDVDSSAAEMQQADQEPQQRSLTPVESSMDVCPPEEP
eukprot:TRINITY_DN5589_c0_g1_i1.p1 TRINITY_DN5589_c0_g1~~TRINITY_DN5589_c0_g1_i1.p1  ORF type:complete len:922 (-),score=192.45 TRINITY_DN5589_c0_g1_i1:215-2980(-)